MENELWVNILFGVLFAAACFYIARLLGRNEVIAAFLGFFFGIFAILFYGILAIFDHYNGRTKQRRYDEEAKRQRLLDDVLRGEHNIPKRPDR